MAPQGPELKPEAALEQLGAALAKLAPKVAPCVVPEPQLAAAAVLSRLYKVPEKQVFQDKGSKGSCDICGAPEAKKSVEWSVNFSNQTMVPVRCIRVCSHCAAIRDLPQLIERLTNEQVAKGRSDTFLADVLRHFLRVNGHDAADAHLMQDAISVAHAMLVIHKELRLTIAKGAPLEDVLSGKAATGQKRLAQEAATDKEAAAEDNASPKPKRQKGKKGKA